MVGLPATSLTFYLVEDRSSLRAQSNSARIPPGEVVAVTIGKEIIARDSASVTVHVRAGAEPLSGLFATIKPWNAEGKRRILQSDASGTLRWDGVAPGAYEVMVALGNPRVIDDYLLRTNPDEPVQVVAGEATHRTITLPTGQLHAILVDHETREPITNAVCFARAADQSAPYEVPGFSARLGWGEQTDSTGHVTLRALPNTLLRVGAGASGYVTSEQTMQPQHEDADPVVIALKKK